MDRWGREERKIAKFVKQQWKWTFGSSLDQYYILGKDPTTIQAGSLLMRMKEKYLVQMFGLYIELL